MGLKKKSIYLKFWLLQTRGRSCPWTRCGYRSAAWVDLEEYAKEIYCQAY